MTLAIDQGTGLEEIGRAAFVILHAELNAQIAAQAARWEARDQEMATLLDRTYVPADVQPILAPDWHLGVRETLVEADPNRFPNLSVMAYTSAPAAISETADQYDMFSIQLFVEAMVNGLDEDVVNRRCQRTADAIVRTIREHRTLDGVVLEVGTAPTITLSDLFARRAETGGGARFWWQGCRIEWTIIRPQTY